MENDTKVRKKANKPLIIFVVILFVILFIVLIASGEKMIITKSPMIQSCYLMLNMCWMIC